jgi:hypothetical protein
MANFEVEVERCRKKCIFFSTSRVKVEKLCPFSPNCRDAVSFLTYSNIATYKCSKHAQSHVAVPKTQAAGGQRSRGGVSNTTIARLNFGPKSSYLRC